MKKLAILGIILLSPIAAKAQIWGGITADFLADCNTSSPGTAMTAAIATACAVTNGSILGTPSIQDANFAIGANQGLSSNLGKVTIGGTVFNAQSLNFNNISKPSTVAIVKNVLYPITGTAHGAKVMSALIALYIPSPTTLNNGNLFDMYGLWAGGANGEYAVLQSAHGSAAQGCAAGAAPSGFLCVRMEGKPTSHSGYFYLQPDHMYWFSFYWNDDSVAHDGIPAGGMVLHAYTIDGTPITCGSPAAGLPLGPGSNGCTTLPANGRIAADVINSQTAVLVAGDNNGGFDHITIGNNENETFPAGNTAFYQNTMFSYSNGANGSGANFPLFWSQSDSWVGVVAPGRAIDFTTAGVVGGIPNITTKCVTTQCATVESAGSSATVAQIDAAIDSCSGSSTYVHLPTGNYTAGFSFRGANHCVVRGDGANKTILKPTSTAPGNGMGAGILINGSDANNSRGTISNPSGCSASNNGACATVAFVVPIKGANTFTLTAGTSSITNLFVGNPIVFDQLDSQTDIGSILTVGMASTYTGTFTAPGNAGPYSTQGSSSYGRGQLCSAITSCYSQQQIVTVTSCNGVSTAGSACTGSPITITISPGLEMPNWTASMFAWWSSSPALNDGVEDLQIDVTNLQATGACGNQAGSCGVGFFNAQNSWLKGVAVVNTGGEALVRVLLSNHSSIVNNYGFLNVNSSTSSYGIEFIASYDNRAENNIVQAVATPLQRNGPDIGNVWAYNFAINNWYTASLNYNIPGRGDHSAGEAMSLAEGNIVNGHTADNVHGTGNLNHDFRNAFPGIQSKCASTATTYSSTTWGTCTQNYEPETILAYHRFTGIYGNVLGTSGVHTTYKQVAWPSGGATPQVIIEGGTGNGLQSNTGTDTNTSNTLMLWGNVDPTNGGSGGTAFTSPQFNCSEVPSTGWNQSGGNLAPWQAAVYYNPCPSSHTLPSSMAYTAKPAFFPSSKPWPLIGPDVSSGNVVQCTSGTYLNALVTNSSQCTGGTGSTYGNGAVNSNPAMDCYFSLGGLPDGTGGQLTNFSEATCYSAAVILSPASQNFGTVLVGSSSSPVTFTLTNNSASTATSITPATIGGNSGDFNITNLGAGSCNAAGGSLTSGSSCTFTVTFIPTANGSRSTTLSVSYSGADGNSPQTAALTGIGQGGSIAPVPILSRAGR